jgi:catechol 2,3-dioxygenase-like lactoylglutathione lyase family enzyme
MGEKLSRREVLVGSAALVAAIHAPVLAGGQGKKNPRTFIRRLKLQTSMELDRMEDFYCDRLGLKRVSATREKLILTGGGTEVTFLKCPPQGQGPLTHLAFNIPQNKIRSALEWTRRKIEVIPAWGDLADPSMPKEIVHFRHWNAHSVFFWDPAYNLLELIARHDLANDATGAFGPKDILCASEIGLPVKEPVAFAKHLNKKGVPAYPGGTAPAFAMGDENGLLLCLQEGQVWGNHTPTPRTWRPYKTEVEIAGREALSIAFPGYPYSIAVKPD